jgi:glycosyltransferase involved in cell wall biosynthesis
MMSIADIGRLTKPVVWTLHDMWAFCGAEHYTDELRYREASAALQRGRHGGRALSARGFGQTASEAHACGTPVVAFKPGGLADIVAHRQTGDLAKPFDVQDMAAGIEWVLGARTKKPVGRGDRRESGLPNTP